MAISTLPEFSAQLAKDPQLQQDVKADPVKAVSNLVAQLPPPLQTDRVIYRIVVSALGLAVLISLIGAIALAFGKGTGEPPQILTAIGSAAVGALAGLLAPSPATPTK